MEMRTYSRVEADDDSDESEDASTTHLGERARRGQRCFSRSAARWGGVKAPEFIGFYGKVSRVLDYLPSRAWLGMLTLPPATVHGSPHANAHVVAYLVFVIVTFHFTKGDGFALDCIRRTRSYLQIVVPFLIGGFATMQVGKWQAKRQNYAALLNHTMDLLSTVGAYIRAGSEHLEESALEARRLACRYTVLAFDMAVLKARGVLDDKERVLPYLKSMSLCSEEEYDLCVPHTRHITVLFWLNCSLKECNEHGLLTDQDLNALTHILCDVRGKARDLLGQVFNIVPYIYANLVGFTIRAYLLITATEVGFQAHKDQDKFAVGGDWHDASQEGEVLILYYIAELFGLYIVLMVFEGNLDMQNSLNNPFLDDLMGVPHESALADIRSLARSIAEGECRPSLSEQLPAWPK